MFNKILDFIEYNTEVRSTNGTILQTEGLSTVRVTTSHQDSTEVSLVGRQVKRFNKWRIKVPRNDADRGRMRDTFFEVTITFDNAEDRAIMLQRIASVFRVHPY